MHERVINPVEQRERASVSERTEERSLDHSELNEVKGTTEVKGVRIDDTALQ
jgi:hypothetical protein